MNKKKSLQYCFWIVVVILILVLLNNQMNTLDPRGAQVQNLYAYLGDNYLDYCDGMPFYESKEANFNDLDEATKMCLAFKLIKEENIEDSTLDKVKKKDVCSLLEDKEFRIDDSTSEDETAVGCSVNLIPEEALNDAYYQLFGQKIKEHLDFNLSGSQICYFDEGENQYVCGNTVVQNLQIGWAPTIYRLITKVKEKGNKVYLYDYFLAMNNNKCYLTNSGDRENTKCSDSIDKNTEYTDKLVSKYGQKYLHIFEKDSDGIYHWISSALVE